MNNIKKYVLVVGIVGLLLVVFGIGVATSPAVTQLRRSTINIWNNPGTPVPGWGGMMGGNNGLGWMGTMMGDIDRNFIELMIPHHQAAIDMASLALQKAQHPEVRALAGGIIQVQVREINEMRAWYRQWYGTYVPNVTSTGMGGMGGYGVGIGGDINDLTSAADFDKAFLAAMIPHHEMALMMSNMVFMGGNKPELQNLAQSIATSQSAEIAQMRTWYRQWYGAGKSTTP